MVTISIKVLSLFDGMSCGQIALERVGIGVDTYYASEIDKYAIKVTQHNYPNTIQLGDVRSNKDWELPKLDLMMAGSPCQDLSRIKSKNRKGLLGDKSSLFYQFYNALESRNPSNFLLENVVMPDKDENEISRMLGVNPIEINSGLFSAQDRKRLYWTNIEIPTMPESNNLVLKDIMHNDVDEKYYYIDDKYIYNKGKRVIANLDRYYPNGKMKFTEALARVYNPEFKSPTLTAVAGGHQQIKVMDDRGIRKLIPLEYERLQTVPDNYTDCVSDSQRYKMLGNGWTVNVIAHIFKGIK